MAAEQDDEQDRQFSGQLSLTQANTLADLERWTESARAAMEAADHFRAARAEVELLYCQIARARALAGLGEIGAAQRAYRGLTAPSNPQEIRSQALNNLALLLDAEGDADTAVDLLRQDASLCAVRGDHYGAMVALANAAVVMTRIERASEARALAKEALSHGEGFEQTPGYVLARKLQDSRLP